MFHSLIKEIWTTTPGLENVMLAGTDGIIIARHHENEQDDFVAVEAASLVKEAHRFGAEMKGDNLVSICTYFQNLSVLIQMVTEDYFLVGIIKELKFLGQIRYRFTVKSNEWYSAIA